MDYTFSTVIVTDQTKAKALCPDYFSTGLSKDGAEPATHWVTQGPFDNTELQFLANDAPWVARVLFGNDVQAALADMGLVQIAGKLEPGNEVKPADAAVAELAATDAVAEIDATQAKGELSASVAEWLDKRRAELADAKPVDGVPIDIKPVGRTPVGTKI